MLARCGFDDPERSGDPLRIGVRRPSAALCGSGRFAPLRHRNRQCLLQHRCNLTGQPFQTLKASCCSRHCAERLSAPHRHGAAGTLACRRGISIIQRHGQRYTGASHKAVQRDDGEHSGDSGGISLHFHPRRRRGGTLRTLTIRWVPARSLMLVQMVVRGTRCIRVGAARAPLIMCLHADR